MYHLFDPLSSGVLWGDTWLVNASYNVVKPSEIGDRDLLDVLSLRENHFGGRHVRWVAANFVVQFSEGFLEFLIACCDCLPLNKLQTSD